MRVVRNDRLSINNCSFTNSTAQLNLPNIAAVAAIVSDTQGGGTFGLQPRIDAYACSQAFSRSSVFLQALSW